MFAWQATVQDDEGNAVPLPVVTVYLKGTETLASIYAEDEVTPLDNPMTGTLDGFVQFWADAGQYKVEGANGGETTEIWNVTVDGALIDAVAAAEAAQEAASSAAASVSGSASDILLNQIKTLPSTFEDDSKYFTSSLGGSPITKAATASYVMFRTVADIGRVAYVAADGSANKILGPKGYLPYVTGRTYRIRATARLVGSFGTGSGPLFLQFRKVNADYTIGSSVAQGNVFSATNKWQTFTFDYTATGTSASWLQAIAYATSVYISTADLEFRCIEFVDITDEVATTSANLTTLTADTREFQVGDVIVTRAEGYRFQVVSANQDITTAGGAKLLQVGGELVSNRTYYVSTTGSDSNNGRSSGSPFSTLQAAANAVRTLQLNTKTVTVSIADGTYTAGADVGGPIVGAPSITNLKFTGNDASPGNVIVSVTGGNCFNATNGARYHVSGVTLMTTTSGNGLNATAGGKITHGNVVFGTCAGFHKQATDGGQVASAASYSITGGAVAHMHSTTGGYILVDAATVTITGTPTFSQYFAGVSGANLQVSASVTWSGSVIGKKFAVHNGGMIRTFDAGLPGTIDGNAYGGGTIDDIHTLEVMRAKASPLLVVNDMDASNQEVARFRGQRTTATDGDSFWNHFQARDDAGQDVNVGRITWTLSDVSNGSETGYVTIGAIHNGSLVNALRVTGTDVQSLLPHKYPVYTVASVPSAGAAGAGSTIYVSNEVGGGVLAFSDGTVWRRVTDRAVVS